MTYQLANLQHQFLEPLGDIPDAPTELWMQGTLPESRRPAVVSIVGSRRCTAYGEHLAYQIAYELAQRGIIVVSGLAYGIDTCAHRGCLDAGGTTIAILGTPIDRIHPRSNQTLADRILEQGAILSEYAPSSRIERWHFLKRNRLVSGIADAVIIVEASLRSGTFTTASQAVEQKKEVFAIPGDIGRIQSAGCNRLISLATAHIYTGLEDFLTIVAPSLVTTSNGSASRRRAYPSPIAAAIIQQMRAGLTDGDQIIAALDLDVSNFNQAITLLELRGFVVPVGCNAWALKDGV
ncbi:DNA-processing protein DprA [Candidatus Saccharibacteria bacterium]|nr:DNA-processing protein DprA [Candidatus Saccharibacteria bacterium]